MQLTVSWQNGSHFLLAKAQVSVTLAGAPVPPTSVATGRQEFTLPAFTGTPTVELTVEFLPDFIGRSMSVLRIRQEYQLQPAPLPPVPLRYFVRPPGASADVAQAGAHPMLGFMPTALGSGFLVTVRPTYVDATGAQPVVLLRPLRKMRTTGAQANVRVLARTDGGRPLHVICATPPSCTSAQATDVLCFLTAPQNKPEDVDDDASLMDATRIQRLGDYAKDFLGTPRHDDALPRRDRDHFSRASGARIANEVLDRRWEDALMASGRHVALVLPMPSNGGHPGANTRELPVILRQLHAALVALGDIAAPSGGTPDPPLLGVAAHSNGGPAMFAAVRAAAASAFAEIWMFEAKTAAAQTDMLALTSARLLYAGYQQSTVLEAFDGASRNARLAGRVRRLPDPPPSPKATPADLAVSSPLFTHMLEGIVTPATAWRPPAPFLLRDGRTRYDERFVFLHQLIVQGNDRDGLHFLTKALTRSSFR
ncbi:MAG TPA: hypothetical protein VKB03_12690 [Conexibacter sp.]|nr:hypothetical protein [Conexibacter sp.]